VTVRARLYDANGADREIDLTAEHRPELDGDQLLWIDSDSRDADELARVAEAIGLEREALQRLQQEDRRSRLLRLANRIVLTLGAVEPDDAEARRHEIDVVIGENHVVTVHAGGLAAVDEFRKEIGQEADLGRLDAVGFATGLLDSILAAYSRQIELIERDIDALDEIAVRSRGDEAFLTKVIDLRRRIARLRRALVPNREALLPLERPDFELRTDIGTLWPGLVQRLERAIDGLENARELLVGSFDLYLGRSSQRTNDVMKVLTLVSSIALPAIVLAGVMGMNFHPGFFDDPENFYVVVAVMAGLSAAILLLARWRQWI
jgi:Mg2+ and Co2+ transporter CorA